MAEDLKKLENSLISMKGHLTRKIQAAEKVLKNAGPQPTNQDLDDLIYAKVEIRKMFEKIEESFYDLNDLGDEEKNSGFEKDLRKEKKRKDECLDLLQKAIKMASSSPEKVLTAPISKALLMVLRLLDK